MKPRVAPIAGDHSSGLLSLRPHLGWLPSSVRSWFGRAGQLRAAALVDQGIVSGTRFFTTIIVGRMAGPSELGFYSLTFTILVAIAVVQEALIMTPYTIYVHTLRDGRRAEYAGSVMVHDLVLSALALGGLLAAGAVLYAGSGRTELAIVLFVLAAMIPFVLLREFGRRLAFAHLNMTTALTLDAATSVIQIGGLLGLAVVGNLSAVTAYVVVGVSSALVGGVWIRRARSQFTIRFGRVRSAWRRNWSFGKWVLASQLSGVTHGMVVYWILAWRTDAAAVGVFAAAYSLVLMSNPLVLGIGNVLGPQAAQAFVNGGGRDVARVVRKTLLFLCTILAVFWVALITVGEPLMVLLYGTEFAGQHVALIVLGVCPMVWATTTAVGSGLRAIERPDVNFTASLVGIATSVAVMILLIGPFRIVGASAGLLIGSVAVAGVQWVAFSRLAGRRG